MIEITPEKITEPLVDGIDAPCDDCRGKLYRLTKPAPNGATLLVLHDEGCPAFPALRAAQAGVL